MTIVVDGRPVRFGLWYDFRNPTDWERPFDSLYAETLEHILAAEELGFDDIWTSEHHFIKDGYSPSLLPICAAIAARTERVRIGTNVLLLPLHDPLRVAEDAATVAVISGGRFDLGVANGYRVGEFEGMHIDRRTRAARMEEAVQVIHRSWEPGSFSFAGTHYNYTDVDVTPKPVQRPAPLWMGGFADAAVRRAGRIADGLLAAANVVPLYLEARKAAGRDNGPDRIALSLPWVAISESPDEDWEKLVPYVFYQRRLYATWFSEAGTPIFGNIPESIEDVRDRSADAVVTPERAAEIVSNLCRRVPVTHLYWWAVPPGVPPTQMLTSATLFMEKAAPLIAKVIPGRCR
ncbi:MAG TPA: LLM class flavin-dependent oxidoreductase [Dehalococcoidia bacterium]|nr:LLM class flavin-dependent oxidoreductase [Dehalococcoidia bacterium]